MQDIEQSARELVAEQQDRLGFDEPRAEISVGPGLEPVAVSDWRARTVTIRLPLLADADEHWRVATQQLARGLALHEANHLGDMPRDYATAGALRSPLEEMISLEGQSDRRQRAIQRLLNCFCDLFVEHRIAAHGHLLAPADGPLLLRQMNELWYGWLRETRQQAGRLDSAFLLALFDLTAAPGELHASHVTLDNGVREAAAACAAAIRELCKELPVRWWESGASAFRQRFAEASAAVARALLPLWDDRAVEPPPLLRRTCGYFPSRSVEEASRDFAANPCWGHHVLGETDEDLAPRAERRYLELASEIKSDLGACALPLDSPAHALLSWLRVPRRIAEQALPPLRVLVCLDISASMTRGPQRQPVLCADQVTRLGVAWDADSPYHHALLAVVLLARALHPRSRLCVLEFGSRTEERIDSEVQDEQGRLMRFGDELFLDGKEFAGATRLEVQEVEDWVASQAGKDQVQVVIVTDGGLQQDQDDLCARLALLRQQHGAQVTIFLVGSTDDGLAVAARGAGLHVVEVRRLEDLGQRIRFEVGVKVS